MSARALAVLSVVLGMFGAPGAKASDGYGSILNTLTQEEVAQEPCPPWLAEYIKFHRANRGRRGAKYIIYTCNKDFPSYWNCGGLGDRLRGIKFCLKMAYVSRRILLVENTRPLPLEANLIPNLIDWTMRGISIDPDSDSVAQFAWKRHKVGEANYTNMDFTTFYGDTRYIRIHTDFAYDTNIPNPPREVDQDPKTGHFWLSSGQPIPRPNLLRLSCLFRTLFRVHPTLRRAYTNTVQRLFPGLPAPRYAAIHFRAGGMATGELIKIQRADDNLASLMRSLACARQRATANNITAPILLLTDNHALRTAIQDGRLGTGVITTRHKAYHIDMSFRESEHKVVLGAARTVYVDLMLLAGAECLVVPTRSGFNQEARAWGTPSCFVSWLAEECMQLPIGDAMRAALDLPSDW